MLLGSTPLSGEEGGEEAGEGRAGADPVAETEASADATRDPAETAPAPVDESSSPAADRVEPKRSVEKTHPIAEASAFAGWKAAGLMIAALGAVVAAAPLVSTQLPQGLERLLDSRVSSGILLVGGLLLFVFAALRRTLQELQRSVEAVGAETARLDEIAVDSQAVLKALHTVRIENTTLGEDVLKLQLKIKRLTEIVSNPDYAGSIFRLAASVDMLGKHVEVHMKEQFGTVDQRLATIAKQAEHADHQLKTLGQVHGLMKEQLRVQELAVQEGFDHLSSTSDKAVGRIEQNLQTAARIEATVKNQQETLSKEWVSLSERLAQSVSQVTTDLNDLRLSVDRQVQSQAETLHVEFEDLDNRIGLAERNQSSGIQQLSEQVQGQLARRAEELQQNLKQLADLTSRGHQEVAGGFGDLGARLDKHSREQQASFQQIRERTTEATKATKGDLAAILEHLRAQLEQLAHDHLAALHQSTQDTHQAAGAAQSELTANLEKVGSRIEKALEARARNLASDLMEVGEKVQSITTEIRSCVAESILRAASARAESGSSGESVGERPRVEFVGPSLAPESSSEPPNQNGSSPPPEVPGP